MRILAFIFCLILFVACSSSKQGAQISRKSFEKKRYSKGVYFTGFKGFNQSKNKSHFEKKYIPSKNLNPEIVVNSSYRMHSITTKKLHSESSIAQNFESDSFYFPENIDPTEIAINHSLLFKWKTLSSKSTRLLVPDSLKTEPDEKLKLEKKASRFFDISILLGVPGGIVLYAAVSFAILPLGLVGAGLILLGALFYLFSEFAETKKKKLYPEAKKPNIIEKKEFQLKEEQQENKDQKSKDPPLNKALTIPLLSIGLLGSGALSAVIAYFSLSGLDNVTGVEDILIIPLFLLGLFLALIIGFIAVAFLVGLLFEIFRKTETEEEPEKNDD